MKLTSYRFKIALGSFRKFSAFVCMPIWLPQPTSFHWRGYSWKSFYLTSWIKHNQWKKLTKLVQKNLGTIFIGWIVAEIFDVEITPELLTGTNQHLFDIFCEIQNAVTRGGSHRSTWFMGHFESVFRALFNSMISFLFKRNCKNVFFLSALLCGQMPLCEMAILKFN